jgi:hypothetical protein
VPYVGSHNLGRPADGDRGRQGASTPHQDGRPVRRAWVNWRDGRSAGSHGGGAHRRRARRASGFARLPAVAVRGGQADPRDLRRLAHVLARRRVGPLSRCRLVIRRLAPADGAAAPHWGSTAVVSHVSAHLSGRQCDSPAWHCHCSLAEYAKSLRNGGRGRTRGRRMCSVVSAFARQ